MNLEYLNLLNDSIKKMNIDMSTLNYKELVKIIKGKELNKILNNIFSNNEEVIDTYYIKDANTNTQIILLTYIKLNKLDMLDSVNLEEKLNSDFDEEIFGDGKFDNYSQNQVRDYKLQIKKYPVLTPAQSNELFNRYRNGEKDLRKVLIESNLKLVVSIAKLYVNRGFSFMDLINEGNLGLMKAVDRYDPSYNVTFATYATPWIKQSITSAIYDKASMIRYPIYLHEILSKLMKAIRTYELKNDSKKPSVEELSEITGFDKEIINVCLHNHMNPLSYDVPINEDDCGQVDYYIDFIEDTDNNIDDNLLREDLAKKIREILYELDERSRGIIELRFGFIDGRIRTFEEISKSYNITRERVRQIESAAIKKLSHPNKTKKIEDYIC